MGPHGRFADPEVIRDEWIGVSLVPEGRAVFSNLTVRENLQLGGERARSVSMQPAKTSSRAEASADCKSYRLRAHPLRRPPSRAQPLRTEIPDSASIARHANCPDPGVSP